MTDKLTEATTPGTLDMPELVIGPPFAMVGDCELLEATDTTPGCVACVRCDCGKAFKCNLLTKAPKVCPGCRATFVHVLLIARADDSEILEEALEHIFESNGISMREENAGDDDEDTDDDEDDDEASEEDEGDEDAGGESDEGKDAPA